MHHRGKGEAAGWLFGARRLLPWWPIASVLSPVPVMAGMLAGPSLSFLPEGQVAAVLLTGVLVGGAVLWVLLARAGSAGAPSISPADPGVRALWLGIASIIGAVGAVWSGQALSDWGTYLNAHAPVATVAGIAAVLGAAGLFALAARRGHEAVVLAAAAAVLLAWVVVASHIPWSFREPLTFNRSVAFACPNCRVPYLQLPAPGIGGFLDDVGLALAGMLLVIPWISRTGGSAAAQRSGTAFGVALVVTGMVFGLMVVGTELESLFYDPGPALMGSVLGGVAWAAVLVALGGGTALFLGVAWGRAIAAVQGPQRQWLILLATLAATFAAALWLFNWPIGSARLTNAEAAALALAYVIAPWAGVAAVRPLLSRPPRSAAAMGLAWAGGLFLSMPGVTGWGRWAGGPLLHTIMPGLAVHIALRLHNGGWALARPPQADWALAAGFLGSATLYGLGAAVARMRPPTRIVGSNR